MIFDPNNPIVKLCADGMMLEGEGKPAEAQALFTQAWEQATNDFERFTTAHYVARHQADTANKLKWDQIAIELALKADDETLRQAYPSLYLNVAKGYEDLGQLQQALAHYTLAQTHAINLPDDGYGNMIRQGIQKGIERVNTNNQ
jgi:tetratricopeptide (TPR) repeat protein